MESGLSTAPTPATTHNPRTDVERTARPSIAPLAVDDGVVQSRARALVDQAQAALSRADEDAAIALLGRAVQLDASAASRNAYQRAVVRRAQRLREQANALLGSDRSKALRLLQDAKRQLHRAYWESGSASSQLRREVHQNALLRKRIVDQATQPGSLAPAT